MRSKNKTRADLAFKYVNAFATEAERELLLPPKNGQVVSAEQAGNRREIVHELVYMVVAKIVDDFRKAALRTRARVQGVQAGPVTLPGRDLPNLAVEVEAGALTKVLPVSWVASRLDEFHKQYSEQLATNPRADIFLKWRNDWRASHPVPQEQARKRARN